MKFLRRFIGDSNSSNEVEESWTTDKYLEEAGRVLEYTWKVLHSANWRLEKQTSTCDEVHSTNLNGVGKVFKAKGVLNMSAEDALDIIFNHPEDTPKWNPVIVESKLLQTINPRTLVTYQVTAERVGGLVARREFVVMTHRTEREGCQVVAGVSVPHPLAPKHKYIRGINGPSCWVLRPIPDKVGCCQLEWLLDTNLRGWLPQYVVDAAHTSIMLDYLNNLRSQESKRYCQAS